MAALGPERQPPGLGSLKRPVACPGGTKTNGFARLAGYIGKLARNARLAPRKGFDMAKHDHCIRCGGVGLLRNENPHSSRVYGEHCPDCNGTGIASNPVWRFNACVSYILFIIGVVYLILSSWP